MKCPKCGQSKAGVPGQVQIFEKVWIQRIWSVYLPPCGVGQLTNAGMEEAERMQRSAWECEDDLLRTLGRVERVEVALGAERHIWHLNLLKHSREILRKMGYGKLFEERFPSATTGVRAPPT